MSKGLAEGLIVKGIGGFYYVKTEGGEIAECRAKGAFRKEKVIPKVGDRVQIQDGSLREILPRKNELVRPPVANIDRVVLVVAVSHPEPNLFLTDQLLAVTAHMGIETLICINKTDLCEASEGEALREIYAGAGYETLMTSTVDKTGIDALLAHLKAGITAFAGASGVGKSSVLNAVHEGFGLKAGEISAKVERGKHTTRHVELLPFEAGYVIDTPGFSSFEVKDIPAADLKECFFEFAPYEGQCRFRGCSHTAEPDCAVLHAVERGDIAASRHEHYRVLFEALKEVKAWENKG